MSNALLDSLYNSYDTTDLQIHVGTGNDLFTDVYYRSLDLIPGLVGLSSCDYWRGHLCDHWVVSFDHIEIEGWSDTALKALACHETGHTVGLTHPNVTNHGKPNDDIFFHCMRVNNYSSGAVGSHGTGHIDNHY